MGLIALGALIILLIQWAAVGGAATTVYFWLFSIAAIVSSARVITHREPVYSALYFVVTVFASAGLFVLLWAEFLAAALVIIYAGAILVTYTFVIMLASEASGRSLVKTLVGAGKEEFDHDVESRSPTLACLAGFVVMGTMLFLIFDKASAVVSHGPIQPDSTGKVVGGLQQLGVYLFTHQAVALQLAGLILTLAMVGALMIARKRVLLSAEEGLTGEVPEIAPYTPVDDNPHSISVTGETGPRTRHRDREMAEL
jgi:NADH-quinone oxidoreductase subunit J